MMEEDYSWTLAEMRAFLEIQKHRMSAIAVTQSGEIVLAIGYNGTLKELPRVEELLALCPNTLILYFSRSQVQSVAELRERVREKVCPLPAAGVSGGSIV